MTLDSAPASLPLVSILINNYNYGHFLSEAIDSALAQTYSKVEVVVVDDGSSDHSAAIIESYGNRIIPVLKENGGQASAFNAGFAVCRGDIICFLDADDAYLPTKVEAIVKTLIDYQQSYWCFHILQFVNLKLDKPTSSHFDQQETGRVEHFDFRPEMRQGGLQKKMPFSIPPTSGLCFTRSLLEQILPMPEAISIALNDSYLQFSALALAEGFTVSQKLALQRIHGNNILTNAEPKRRALGISRVNCFTSHWLVKKFDFLQSFADNFFAVGLAAYWCFPSQEVASVVEQYLASRPLSKKLRIYFKAFYYRFLGQT
jgi:glycosyltransferase involved in cell wall biosynthesis